MNRFTTKTYIGAIAATATTVGALAASKPWHQEPPPGPSCEETWEFRLDDDPAGPVYGSPPPPPVRDVEQTSSSDSARWLLDHLEAQGVPPVPQATRRTSLTAAAIVKGPDGVDLVADFATTKYVAVSELLGGLLSDNPHLGICQSAYLTDPHDPRFVGAHGVPTRSTTVIGEGMNARGERVSRIYENVTLDRVGVQQLIEKVEADLSKMFSTPDVVWSWATAKSTSQVRQELNLSASYGPVSASADIARATSSNSHVVVALLRQVYYRLRLASPDPLDVIDLEALDAPEARARVAAATPQRPERPELKNALAVVDRLDMGRLLFLRCETRATEADVRAAVAFALSHPVADLELKASQAIRQAVETTTFEMCVLGGASNWTQLVSGQGFEGLAALKNVIEAGADLTDNVGAAPVGMAASYLWNGQPAYRLSTADWTFSTREPVGEYQLQFTVSARIQDDHDHGMFCGKGQFECVLGLVNGTRRTWYGDLTENANCQPIFSGTLSSGPIAKLRLQVGEEDGGAYTDGSAAIDFEVDLTQHLRVPPALGQSGAPYCETFYSPGGNAWEVEIVALPSPTLMQRLRSYQEQPPQE